MCPFLKKRESILNHFEELVALRNQHRREENELIYQILIDHLKPSEWEKKEARVKLFDEEMPEEFDSRKYGKIIEKLKYRMERWERDQYEKYRENKKTL